MRARRFLARLLVVLLVPVVIFSTPQTAQAVEAQQGPWVGASFAIDQGFDQDGECEAQFSFRTDSLAQSILRVAAGYCRAGVDHSPWTCQTFEPDCTEYRFTFTGPGCESIVLDPATRELSEDSFTSIHSGWGADESLSGSCDPTHACLTVASDLWNGGNETHQACEVIALERLQVVNSDVECGRARLGKPGAKSGPEHREEPWDPSSWAWLQELQLDLDITTPGDSYIIYVIKKPGNLVVGTAMQGETLGQQLVIDYYGSAQFDYTQPWTYVLADTQTTDPEPVPTEILGIGYFRQTIQQSGGTWTAHADSTKLPQYKPLNGRVGITNPSICASYWGVKIADTATDDYDLPAGSFERYTEPDPNPPADSPVTDPPAAEDDQPADEPGFWAAILGILRAIWSGIREVVGAIAGLAASIVEGILSGFSAAFVPSTGFFESKVEQVQGAWSQTPPGVVVGEVTGLPGMFSAPSSAGCQGVPLAFDMPFSGPVVLHPFDACGPRANWASIVRLALQLTVCAGAFLASVRVLGSAFGVDTSLGRGDSAS